MNYGILLVLEMMKLMKYKRKKNRLPKLHSNLILTSSFTMDSDSKEAQLAKKVTASSIVELATRQADTCAALEIAVRKISSLLV